MTKTIEEIKQEDANVDRDGESLLLIGVFLAVFGLAVMTAIFFTETERGRITNAVCGLVFLLTAALAILRSRRRRMRGKR